mgnify:CR=1 FL=1
MRSVDQCFFFFFFFQAEDGRRDYDVTGFQTCALPICPKGQRVNILAPGYIDTAILEGDSDERRALRESEVPLRRIGTSEDMAGVVSFLVSEDSAYVNGAIIHANGGLYLP